MSDEKETKEVKDEELDKVSGGHGANVDMGHIKKEEGHVHEEAGRNVFTGVNKTK